ncbi:MAG: 5-oxoprolinase subunit PxpB [Neobacillus sp.]
MRIEIQPLGDVAIRISFGNEISETTHKKIQRFVSTLNQENIPGIVEWVPTYTSVAIYYRPEIISYSNLIKKVESVYSSLVGAATLAPIIYKIPVYYGGETGPDLSFVAQYHQLTEQEVIELHTKKEYLIHMIGFMPGFPYLGGLPEGLSVPRLEHPRSRVEPGSVGIGGNQTGIYPNEVPSGWRILGITPVKLFDFDKSEPFLFSSGNYIHFYSITLNEYKTIKRLVEHGRFQVETVKAGGARND